MKRKEITPIIAGICILATLLGYGAIISSFMPAVTSYTTSSYQVLLLGNGNDLYFEETLQIDTNSFEITQITDMDASIDLSAFDLVILFDPILSLPQTVELETFIESGGGVLFILGSNIQSDPSILQELEIISPSANLSLSNVTMLPLISDKNHPIAQNIDWNSAPALKINRVSLIDPLYLNQSAQSIINMYPSNVYLNHEDYALPLLFKQNKGLGSITVFTGWLDRNDQNSTQNANRPYYVWPYFNYLFYSASLDAMGETDQILDFEDWAYSPVPHLKDQIWIFAFVLILGTITIVSFIYIKRKIKNPVQTDLVPTEHTLNCPKEEILLEEKPKLANQIELESRESLKNPWELIGNHRQLSGFLTYFFIGLIVILPQIIISSFVLPKIIGISYAQARGWYGYTARFFKILWTLLDLGTATVLVKRFSEHRIKNPEKAMHYVQIYVWWQILSGVFQVFIIAFIGSLIFPQTQIAHMSWVFISFSMVQYPGFFIVFLLTLRGLQRIDLYLILQVCWDYVFLLIGQILFCYLGRIWGEANPSIGPAIGVAIGFAIANYFRYWMTFWMGLIIFKKLGYSPKKCFRVGFSTEEIKDALTFGSKITLGTIFAPLITAIQVILISSYVANYSSELGYYDLAHSIAEMVQIIWLYALSLLGAFSESISHKKTKLTNLYLFQGFRWLNFFGFFVCSIIYSTGKYFLIGTAGEELGLNAAEYLGIATLVQILFIYNWLSNNFLNAANKPLFNSMTSLIVQVIRFLMLVFLIYTKSLIFIIYAFIPGLILSDIISWIYIYKKTKFKLYVLKSFIAPISAAILNYLVMRFLSDLIFSLSLGDKVINTGILYLVAMFVSITLFSFLDGFFGGFDENTLKEFKKAVLMQRIKFIKTLAIALYKCAEFGTKLSPLQKVSPISIYNEAAIEAFELTLEKKTLNVMK